MRRLLIATALSAAGLTAAGCDPYYYGAAPGPYGSGPYPDARTGYPAGPYAGGAAAGPVSFLGCPIPGVEPNCLSVRSVDGRMFDISAAQARPDPRSPFAVEVSGQVASAVGYCQQGTILQNVQVRQTNLRCVGGAVQGYVQPYPRNY
ncbi:MAG: hypothetical protein M3M95_04800 [Pseudomonadota bacterium]|nr:hypothetical protein [Pseudomonadota bacterium]